MDGIDRARVAQSFATLDPTTTRLVGKQHAICFSFGDLMFRSLLISLCLVSASHAMADTVAYRCTGPTTGAVRVLDHDGDACLGFVANG
jgi:hypothetical protein